MSDKIPADLPRTFGNYSLLKLLARGGMGEIYLARTVGITGFEKYYAVKKLLRKFTHDNDVGGRFVDEAKLGARLQHPNIVQVYDLGKVKEELYMATEFVDGFDLRRVLRFCHEKKKRIPLDIALFIVREVLSGLAYAHRQVDADGALINLIHRDISPQNVLVSFEGEVKIIDFGLAKSTQRSEETQANVLLGNFGYMSPEQARGQILDVRTDIYSAGIVLFELVPGTKRFVEENPLKLLEMVARPTPIMPSDRVPTVPRAIDRIFERATSQDRDARFSSAESFRDDVTAALHRLNPRASRENLAQFLNHLFLGGQAPPSVDADVLNKSVVLMAKDLHAGTDALSSTAAEDVKNRSLSSEFSETALQTSSHPLLRSARVGDVLTHEAITGEAGPVQQVPLLSDDDDGVQLIEGFDHVGMTTQMQREHDSERPPSSQDGALVSVEHDEQAGQATKVYESLSWPQGNAREPELAPTNDIGERTEIRDNVRPSSSELDVQRQLDEQAHAQAEIQQQMEAQARRAQMQGQLEQARIAEQLHQAEAQRVADAQRLSDQQRQAETQRQAEAQHQLEAQQQAEAQRQLEQQRLAEVQRQAQLEELARQQMLQRQLEQQARLKEQQLLEAAAAPLPPTAPRGPVANRRIQSLGSGTTTTETMMPAVDIPIPTRRPPAETPSIMLSPELEAEMVSALPMTLDDATRRNPRAAGGFGEGGAHESLIIDFGGDQSSDAEEFPVVEGLQASIRPAAKPMARPVGPAATAPRPRRAADEGPPTSMPPPTRRR